MSQNYLRVISIDSQKRVYHNRGCRYVQKMKKGNKLTVTRYEAGQMGYRPCACCNSMSYHFRNEKKTITDYAVQNAIKLCCANGLLYIKTEAGLWKIIYSRINQKFMIFHGNQPYKDLDIQRADTAAYHRQRDKKTSDSIVGCLIYIQRHDQYRRRVEEAGGNEMAVPVGRKYEKQRERRLRRQSDRRVEMLFSLLERENAGYRELTFC